ncbi:MAG: flagellar export protein FliJ [Lachnospiraceae bacterium]|nr:flagellar export protein FliJ [Lachnospiraceae bacterium]
MSKFIYKMQNILNIKYKLEEQARLEFAAANRHLMEEEEILMQVRERQALYEQEGRRLRQESISVVRLRENRAAMQYMEQREKQQQTRVQKAQKAVDEKMEQLTDTMKERKAQEKLRENAFADFIQEENARESKEIDELVSFNYGRKQREEQ